MKDNLTIREGDVFRFGESDRGWGFGQILISRTLQFVVIFETLHRSAKPDDLLGLVLREPVFLAGWTMDARLQSGAWVIVGNEAVREFALPHYKVEIRGKVWVTDCDGKAERLATPHERQHLRYKTSHSPIAFEKAFWAHHDGAVWQGRFDDLLAPRDDGQGG